MDFVFHLLTLVALVYIAVDCPWLSVFILTLFWFPAFIANNLEFSKSSSVFMLALFSITFLEKFFLLRLCLAYFVAYNKVISCCAVSGHQFFILAKKNFKSISLPMHSSVFYKIDYERVVSLTYKIPQITTINLYLCGLISFLHRFCVQSLTLRPLVYNAVDCRWLSVLS